MKSGNKKAGKHNGKGNKGSNGAPSIPVAGETISIMSQKPVEVETIVKEPSIASTVVTDAVSMKEANIVPAEDTKEAVEEDEVLKSVPPIVGISTLDSPAIGVEDADGFTSWRDVDSPVKSALVTSDNAPSKESARSVGVVTELFAQEGTLKGAELENSSHKTASTYMSDLTNVRSDKSVTCASARESTYFQTVKSGAVSLLGQMLAVVFDAISAVVSFYQQLLMQSLTKARELVQAAVSWYLCTLLWLVTLPYLLAVEALTFGLRATVTAVVYFLNSTPGGGKIPTVGGRGASSDPASAPVSNIASEVLSQ